MARTVGIDLGTTNSVVSCLINDRLETIPNSEGAKTTPSVVLFGPEEVVVGELAKRQSVTQAGLVVRSAKRLMGRRFAEVADQVEDFHNTVIEGAEGRAEVELSDGRVIPPELVAAQVLRKMIDTAEDFLGEEVGSAVITVPAYFNDSQRTATKRAAELIGLEVSRIINEPTAAALAYGLNREERNRKIAVFDFGGGTFDISILQLQGDIFEVLSTNGNTNLGGDNIDQKITGEICDGILQSTGIDPTQDLQSLSRVREAAEKAKIELSSLGSTHISLPFIVADASGPKHFERDITRDDFIRWIQPLLDQLTPPCRNALKDAHLTVAELDEVILVGGSTRIPRVQQIVEEFFQRTPNRSINPDEAVAIGAAIQAGVMRGELQEILLLDVTPLSLGIELAGGIFKPLIERNASIPCEATRRFTTVVDNQTSVLVHVLQGERARATENRSLARFRLTGVPPMPKELPEIEVTFRIDANGILEVSAVDLTSGISTGIQVEGYGECAPMSETEIKKLLEEVEKYGKEDREFVRDAHRRAQADRVQDRMNKILEAAINEIPDNDLKTIKETMLRQDLAISARDWMMADTHEAILQEMIERYEMHLELHEQLQSQFKIAVPHEEFRLPPADKEASDEDIEFESVPDPDAEIYSEDTVKAVDNDELEALEERVRATAKPRPTSTKPPSPPAPLPPTRQHAEAPKRSPLPPPKVIRDGVLEAEKDFDPNKVPPPPPPPA